MVHRSHRSDAAAIHASTHPGTARNAIAIHGGDAQSDHESNEEQEQSAGCDNREEERESSIELAHIHRTLHESEEENK